MRLEGFKIHEKDISEKFIKAKGPGGQHTNKTSSCVYLRHIPTGIEVKCQKERSQMLNRYIARKILIEKIIAYKSAELLKKKSAEEKIKRRFRRRPKRIKIKILENKRRHAEKKRFRFKKINLE